MSDVTVFQEDSISGFLHVPAAPSNNGLVLTHGAGANCQTPLLVAVAEAFEDAGFTVLRCDLPFRQKRPGGPPHPSQAGADREGLRAAVVALRRIVSGRIVLGGHSYGGRQASILASEDGSVSDALLLLSYPLHPPNKPDQLRTAHFPQLQTPALFVHGTKDPFGTTAELQTALRLIPSATELSIVEGAGHDLKRGRFDIAALILERLHLIK
jgi:predicted alpha/beta-hydrolase family hydrolase